jgi:putative Mg2+ transporter-C (MgtC) family protein
MEPLPYIEVVLRVAMALGLGALIGLEREWRRHRAGIRTMILISVGSAGFMLLGIETFAQDPVSTTGQAEISRVIQGLIGGIGFLGAGTIIHNRAIVYGLTTAAAVFCVAAIGAACGLGHYAVASTLAGATIFTLVFLRYIEAALFPPPPGGIKRYGPDPSPHHGPGPEDEIEQRHE